MHATDTDPAQHYNRVTLAWRYLLGDDLHYGYFEKGDELLEHATESLTRRMAEAGRIEQGHAVLDVGCGIGGPASYLAKKFGCSITGITNSSLGADLATSMTTRAGLANQVRILVRDGMRNEFDRGSFDRIWVMESSHLMDDRHALFAECSRVMRPDARLVLCDIFLKKEISMRVLLRHGRKFKLLDQVFGRARMETMKQYSTLASSVGLTVDSIEDITQYTFPTFDRWRANAYRNRDQVVNLIGLTDWDRFVQSCSILEDFWNDGTLGYGILSAVRR